MGKKPNLIGQKFGRLTVTELYGTAKGHKQRWKCVCDCGGEAVVTTNNLTSGQVKSCGCYQKEVRSKTKYKHGMSHSRIYRIWSNMKARCETETNKAYELYGGRGISVCAEWEEFIPFRDWALSNGYQDNLTLDRINNDGNYEPENCRWATPKEQGNNTRCCHYITYNGETKTVRGWEEALGYSRGIIYSRLKSGWSVERAIEEKPHQRKAG